MPSPNYEAGNYRAKITGQRFGELPTGTPYFALDFEPIQSLGANEFPETVYQRDLLLFLSQGAAQYTIEKLRRIGWEGSRFSDLDPTREGFDSLAGIEIDVTCGRNDKGYETWDLMAAGGRARESDSALPAKLDKLFGKALKASAPRKAAVPQPAAQEAEDDVEVPF